MITLADSQSWVQVAEEDYKLAQVALRRKTPLTYGACFHAQQCAEKYLKAALVSRQQPFPRVHDLAALSDLCAQAGMLLGISSDDLDTLSSYAVRARYPGEQPTPTEAHEAVQIANGIRKLLRAFLSL